MQYPMIVLFSCVRDIEYPVSNMHLSNMFKQFRLFAADTIRGILYSSSVSCFRFNLIILPNMDLTNGLVNDRYYRTMCSGERFHLISNGVAY